MAKKKVKDYDNYGYKNPSHSLRLGVNCQNIDTSWMKDHPKWGWLYKGGEDETLGR